MLGETIAACCLTWVVTGIAKQAKPSLSAVGYKKLVECYLGLHINTQQVGTLCMHPCARQTKIESCVPIENFGIRDANRGGNGWVWCVHVVGIWMLDWHHSMINNLKQMHISSMNGQQMDGWIAPVREEGKGKQNDKTRTLKRAVGIGNPLDAVLWYVLCFVDPHVKGA